MRKEIILPNTLLPDLKLLAFNADKTVKKMMEDILINYIKEHTAKLNRVKFPPM